MLEFKKFFEDELSGTTSKVVDDPGYRPQVINYKYPGNNDKTLNLKLKSKKLNFSKKMFKQ